MTGRLRRGRAPGFWGEVAPGLRGSERRSSPRAGEPLLPALSLGGGAVSPPRRAGPAAVAVRGERVLVGPAELGQSCQPGREVRRGSCSDPARRPLPLLTRYGAAAAFAGVAAVGGGALAAAAAAGTGRRMGNTALLAGGTSPVVQPG